MVTLIDRLGIPIRSKINNKNVYSLDKLLYRPFQGNQKLGGIEPTSF